MIAAHVKKNARYILPRIAQLYGFLALSLSAIIFLAIYFSGASERVNGWFAWIYESIYLDEPMSREDRREFSSTMK